MKHEYAQPTISLTFKLLSGSESLILLEQADAQESWSQLIESSPDGSVFQHPSFVLDWYHSYAQKFSPLVLLGYAEQELVGILALAQPKSKKQANHLVGAGSVFALYQTWVVKDGYLKIFWEEGIIKHILDKGYSINLKSLPGEHLVLDLKALPSFQKFAILEVHNNPVLDLQNEGIKEVLGKRHFKAKFNRFQRAGETKFYRLTEKKDFDQSFSGIQTFLNLRQGAAFNKFPLAKDPEQEAIFAKWFESGVLQATILQLDGDLIAAVMTIDDFGKTSHLAGLITYSPIHAKLSPGLVHVYMLAYYLQEQGYQDLKLSPGDDAYKERFANRKELMQEVLLSKNPLELAKRKARIRFREYLKAKGIRTMAFQVDLSKKKADLKNKFVNLLKPLKTHAWDTLIQSLLQNRSNYTIKMNTDGLKDLLLVTDACLDISRWRFLEDALERLENQEKCVTIMHSDKLIVCIWYREKIEKIEELNLLQQESKITKIYSSRHLKV